MCAYLYSYYRYTPATEVMPQGHFPKNRAKIVFTFVKNE